MFGSDMEDLGYEPEPEEKPEQKDKTKKMAQYSQK